MCTCAMSGFIKLLFTAIFRSEKERTGGGMKRDSREGAFFLENAAVVLSGWSVASKLEDSLGFASTLACAASPLVNA